ncbi:hypothetical protein [Pseudoclavibacter terrae]|uniref:Uncharacterized protein n=1 Tax=Pseudoclavibacter terrae TaxID=1530195 RepID=A0A7J5B582_9MICO|nr:hypothetical protein [Pseudoclavibacter terrae]KAB1639335.1 hypothetical protein F8O03_03075 [Pseudoclavibacter terrae]
MEQLHEEGRASADQEGPHDTRIAKGVVVLSLLTLGVPLAAFLWLVLFSRAAMPRALGPGTLPGWLGSLPVLEPASFLTMLGALALLLLAAAAPTVLSSLARDLALKLHAQHVLLLAGALVTARAVCRLSAIGTLVVALLFVTASALSLTGGLASAGDSTPTPHGEAQLTDDVPPDDRDVEVSVDTSAADAERAMGLVTPEQRAGVVGLAEATMALVPTAAYVRDSAGGEPLQTTARFCTMGSEEGVAVDVSAYFQTDGQAFDGEAIRTLWGERGLTVSGTLSEINGDTDGTADASYTTLFYDTDGVFVLMLLGQCRSVA